MFHIIDNYDHSTAIEYDCYHFLSYLYFKVHMVGHVGDLHLLGGYCVVGFVEVDLCSCAVHSSYYPCMYVLIFCIFS